MDFQGELSWDLSADDFVRQSPAGDDFTSGGTFVRTNDVASYQIWRSALGGDYELIATEDGGQTSYLDAGVESGVSYTYAVTAVDGAGNASAPVESETVNFGPAGKAETELPPDSPPVVQEAKMELDIELTINAATDAAWDAWNRAFDARIAATFARPRVQADVDAANAAFAAANAALDAVQDAETKEFKADFIHTIATLLNIDPARITITRLAKGSTIATFEIADDPDSPASEVIAELNNIVETDPQVFVDAGLGSLLDYQTSQTTAVDFGEVQADADSSTALSFTNSSTDPDAILIVSSSLEGVGFSATPAKLTLGSGQSGSIDVSFAAADVGNVNGTYTGTLTIITNDPNNALIVVSLSATVVGGLSGAVADVSTQSISFPRTTVDGFSSRELTISNKGGLPLGVVVSISGDDAFSLSEEGTITLAGGESQVIEVVFAPVEAIVYTASISITTDDPAHPQFDVALSGTGVPEGGPPRLIGPDGEEIFGDFSGDASVTFDDFFLFADNFGLTSASPNWDASFDLSGDEAVTFDDFFIFADYFGKSGTYESSAAASTEIFFTASLDEQQAGGTGSTGTGIGDFSYTDEGGLTYEIIVEGLTGAITVAHIHQAAAGTNGSPVLPLSFTEESAGVWVASGTWDSSNGLTAALVDELKAGNLYVNVHTAAHTSGEIRGQIIE